MTIHQKLKACGVETSHHEGDLYARINAASEAIVASYEYRKNVSKFTADDGSGQWFEIPFAYEPETAKVSPITRADYMAAYHGVEDWQTVQTAAHRAYYRQYVTAEMKTHVEARFGVNRLSAGYAMDRHFNDGFRLADWDGIAVGACSSSTLGAKLRANGDGLSLSSQVCIIKQAAEMVVEEAKKVLRVSWYDRTKNEGGQFLTRDPVEAKKAYGLAMSRGFEVDPIGVETPAEAAEASVTVKPTRMWVEELKHFDPLYGAFQIWGQYPNGDQDVITHRQTRAEADAYVKGA